MSVFKLFVPALVIAFAGLLLLVVCDWPPDEKDEWWTPLPKSAGPPGSDVHRFNPERNFKGHPSTPSEDCMGCDLQNADLRGAYLSGANLSNANLSGTNLAGANLYDADLRGANLRGANLTNARLAGANLSGADLTEASLYYAGLNNANLDGVIGANLTNSLNVPAKYLKD